MSCQLLLWLFPTRPHFHYWHLAPDFSDNHLGCPRDPGSQNSDLPLDFGHDPAAPSFEASQSHNALATKAAPGAGPERLGSACEA